MKLLVFDAQDGPTLGVVSANGVVPLDRNEVTPASVLLDGEAALARVRAALDRSSAQALAEADGRVGARAAWCMLAR